LNVGEVSIYTLGIASVGAEPATEVFLTETPDLRQRILAAVPAAGECNIGRATWGGEVGCRLGTIAPQVRPGQVLSGAMSLIANETVYTAPVTTYGQDCHVRLNDEMFLYHNVQTAVDAAEPGDLIKVAGPSRVATL
jgi:hypothetical protein